MGKRSRKRQAGTVAGRRAPARSPAPARAAAYARPVDRKARPTEAPAAPWSPFPLVELGILVGLVLVIVGFARGGERHVTLLAAGFTLISLAAIELSAREHLAGFRSHTTLLSAVLALGVVVPLYLATPMPQVVLLIIGAVVFAVGFFALRATFARRAGGLGFRA